MDLDHDLRAGGEALTDREKRAAMWATLYLLAADQLEQLSADDLAGRTYPIVLAVSSQIDTEPEMCLAHGTLRLRSFIDDQARPRLAADLEYTQEHTI